MGQMGITVQQIVELIEDADEKAGKALAKSDGLQMAVINNNRWVLRELKKVDKELATLYDNLTAALKEVAPLIAAKHRLDEVMHRVATLAQAQALSAQHVAELRAAPQENRRATAKLQGEVQSALGEGNGVVFLIDGSFQVVPVNELGVFLGITDAPGGDE